MQQCNFDADFKCMCWHNKRLLLYTMINLSSVSAKLTQFCKQIKQQNLQPKVQLTMLNASCQGCPY